MSKSFYVILAIVILAIILVFVYRGPSAPEDQNYAAPAEGATVLLDSQNDSGKYGAAELTESDGKVMVTVDLVGAPEDVAQPSHIHMGSCAELGDVVYPLTSLTNGQSETILDVSLTKLTAELPLAVNVHKSGDEVGVYVACGDIEL